MLGDVMLPGCEEKILTYGACLGSPQVALTVKRLSSIKSQIMALLCYFDYLLYRERFLKSL